MRELVGVSSLGLGENGGGRWRGGGPKSEGGTRSATEFSCETTRQSSDAFARAPWGSPPRGPCSPFLLACFISFLQARTTERRARKEKRKTMWQAQLRRNPGEGALQRARTLAGRNPSDVRKRYPLRVCTGAPSRLRWPTPRTSSCLCLASLPRPPSCRATTTGRRSALQSSRLRHEQVHGIHLKKNHISWILDRLHNSTGLHAGGEARAPGQDGHIRAIPWNIFALALEKDC